jgi:hypothetical protein
MLSLIVKFIADYTERRCAEPWYFMPRLPLNGPQVHQQPITMVDATFNYCKEDLCNNFGLDEPADTEEPCPTPEPCNCPDPGTCPPPEPCNCPEKSTCPTETPCPPVECATPEPCYCSTQDSGSLAEICTMTTLLPACLVFMSIFSRQ